MTVWYHLPTIFKHRLALRIAAFLIVSVAIITTAIFGISAHAAPGINKTLSFQGRLLDSEGATVPDGSYNIRFTIYEGGTGNEAGNPSGTAVWTETYRNDTGTSGVTVTNGYLTVALGSLVPFGTSVDWNDDTLWLSMNIAGAAEACTTFGSSPCVDDGEMLPMKRLTATPYSLNSGLLNGKASDEFIQLASGVQTDASDSTSIFLNKTGTGNLIQLQNTATDIFTVTNSGDITLGSAANKTISVATAATDTSGSGLLIVAGNGGSGLGADGGDTTIQGGAAGGTDGNGGDVILSGGEGMGTGVNGQVIISTPTFATATEDANCYTGGALVSNNCTITLSSVNNSAAVIVGFDTASLTATLPDPTLTTAGRIFYIMAPLASEKFTLAFNSTDEMALRANTTTSMMWNGNDWTVVGTSTTTLLEDPDNGTNVQIGNGEDDATTTVITLDKAASAPTLDASLVGSMYYDTSLGKIQCYEADGWGACSTQPDTYVTLSPEYTNAVTNGDGVGTLSSNFCSDSLDINDGSSSQPTVCGTNETKNYYQWTSSEVSAQSKSIYVTYQLPSSFEEFVSGSTSLLGRTDSADASVSYQMYRDQSTGLTACGSSISVSTGSQSTWQQAAALSGNDPAACSFVAGESIVIKITVSAANDANAYVSTLGFAYR